MSHTQLINKGGFRERANRSRKYQQSENKQTALPSNKYQPLTKLEENPTAIAQAGTDNTDSSNS
ncbi:hypothetical protein IC800_09945 [Acinetobacter seifertii]|uniref:hypothetical protein n=1 Tax=Acinetobacter seifertii TaxID=1530123 RepID=UPI00168D313E|nr:hypothetical protein [Acinetobacter seifertii]QNW93412.1 hypothetical protein IC800_09945 [Acinetobacter seifertii]QNX00499.1 hypothetical protein IC798_10370 [Acinetobacter seifertii]